MVSKEFEKATIEIEQINGKLSNDNLLDVSPCAVPAPGYLLYLSVCTRMQRHV